MSGDERACLCEWGGGGGTGGDGDSECSGQVSCKQAHELLCGSSLCTAL